VNARLRATGVSDEVRSLVATLREAEQRLDALTAGQVDAITDADGRTFLLQRAQEGVRRGDAARRAAILNSLPANIVLLDAEGCIVAVNESWRQFGIVNGLEGGSADVGANYIDVCIVAAGHDVDGARGIADGLSSVLAGSAKLFTAEYPCHSPTRQRWFQMTATPLGDDGPGGIVVMHLDITDRVCHENELRASEAQQRESSRQLGLEHARLVAAQRAAKVGSWEIDLASGGIIWSEETYRILEVDPAHAPPSLLQFRERVSAEDSLRLDAALVASMRSRSSTVMRHRLFLAEGRSKFLEQRWQVVFDDAGLPIRVVGTCQDVSEGRLAEERIERLNRGYRVLSQISALVARARDRNELFHEACRIAVESGGFALARIATVDRTGACLVPVATAAADGQAGGDGDRLSLLDDACPEPAPSVRAVRSGEAVVVNDAMPEAGTSASGLGAAPALRSNVALPITVAGNVIAVLSLHASAVDYFDAAELRLITEVAGEIAFAVDHIGKTEQIDHLAYFDSLTGLANRRLFLERAAQGLRGAADAGQSSAMVLLDIERFKSINDSFGTHVGDGLLKQVAAWLAEHLDDPGLLARVGSDQFALVLTDSPRPGDAMRNLERLIQAFHDQQFLLDGAPFRIAAKFGVAMFPEDATTANDLFPRTESALKNAKSGGHRRLFYTQKMTDSIARKLGQENRLRHALDNEEFVLHYQPKVGLSTGSIVGAEALIRWHDARTDIMTPPSEFITILEETGLIIEVGRWAMRRALDDYLRWRREGIPAVRVAVNVSPVQLRDPRFIEQVRELVSLDPMAPAGLELEITESMIMTDIEQSIAALRELRDMGVRVAIDDFGTGFSSLGYLSKLPVDALKIDRSFIDGMCRSQQALSLVSTMITLAHSFDLEVVAEGVETDEQASLLKLLNCDEAQGYLYGRPVACSVFESLLLAGRSGDLDPSKRANRRRRPEARG